MTAEEIFKTLSSHMVTAMMIHDQLADAFAFLNLNGFKRISEYQFKKESACYRKLHRYYIDRYHKLVSESRVDDPALIPSSWHNYTRPDVDINSKRNAVKNMIGEWVSWEKDTKKLYQGMSKELEEIGEVSASMYVDHLITEVDNELKRAERLSIDLASADYDMTYILDMQKPIHDKYKALMKKC